MAVSEKSLRENPLFQNRRRMLAVVSPAKNPETRNNRQILFTLTVAGLVVGIFLVGLSLAQPVLWQEIGTKTTLFWRNLLVNFFGESTGSKLAEKSTWLVARLGGILSYLLLFAAVALGMLRWRGAQVIYLHKLISLLSLVFTFLHAGSLLLDSYLKISLEQLFVPFSTSYRPLWVGLGTLAVYLMAAIVVTAYQAKRLGFKAWKAVHFLSYLLFVGGFAHGFFAGTDTRSLWMQAIYGATGCCVAFLTGLRFFR